MSEEEQEYEYVPPQPEDFEPFLNSLENLIKNPKQRTHKNILDYEKGILNFDVNYRSLHSKSLQLQFAETKKIETPLYNNHHYGPLKNHNLFEDIQKPTKLETEQFINNNMAKNIIYSEIKNQVFGEKNKCEEIKTGLKQQINNQYLKNLNLKQKNSFVPTYKFNLLNQNFEGCTTYDTINPDSKEFSFETSTATGSYRVRTQMYKRKPINKDKIKKFDDLESEFKNMASGIKSDFDYQKEQESKQNNQDDTKLSELAEQNLKIIKLLSLNSTQWDEEEDDKQNQAMQNTFDEIGNYDKLWNQICDKFTKKIDENQNTEKVENQRKTGLAFLKSLENLKIEQIDEIEKREREEKERAEQLKKAEDINSKFKIIKISDIARGFVAGNASFGNFRWSQEDETDMDTFYDRLPLDKFAIQYGFELDVFQKRAILRLENSESILVCAHTSAGKTVVAEYAIALSSRHKRRCIYTSPIKALSNEKYRKLSRRFDGDVGIITGDVTLNPQATCLIVTTEILRNMLYKGNDMIRDIEWVIFDEVHYINNPERGVVWEETIIMLPDHINIIMLSATIPNYMDFANWVGRTKKRKIHVQKTFWRPVPLEHSIYIFNKFHVVKESDGPFLEDGYEYLKNSINEISQDQIELQQRLLHQKLEKQEKGKYKDKSIGRQMKNAKKMTSAKFIGKLTRGDIEGAKHKDERRNLYELITHCQKEDLLPCVIFIFSKNKIQQLSEGLSFMTLVTKQEESRIIRYFDKAIQKLKPRDQCLPQIFYLRKILSRGLGVHHGDLIPIAKEIVEILFSEGLIKVLLATETFAMGLNMPTKTAIFFAIKKHDGKEQRLLNSSEYTQMAGRAGRRGLDAKGTVILYFSNPDDLPERADMKRMIAHQGEQIKSKFKITYEVILNKLNSKELNVIDMMRSSFSENDRFSQLPKNLQRIKLLKEEFKKLSDFDCPYMPKAIAAQAPIEEYFEISENLREMSEEYFMNDPHFMNKLVLPKFVLVLGTNNMIQVGLLLNFEQTYNQSRNPFEVMLVQPIEIEGLKQKKKLVLQYETENMCQQPKKIRDKNYVFKVVAVAPYDIIEIFNDKIQLGKAANQKIDINNHNVLQDLALKLMDKQSIFSEKQVLDSKGTQNKKNMDFQKVFIKGDDTGEDYENLRNIKNLTASDFIQSRCHNCELLDDHLTQIQKRQKIQEELEQLIKDVDENSLNLKDNFEGRVEVLRSLKYIDPSNQPLIKASIARELGEAQIYMCELIVENIVGDLKPEEIAALLSGFVCQYKPKRGQEKEHTLDYLSIKDDFETVPIFSDEFQEAAEKTYSIVQKIVAEEIRQQVVFTGEPHKFIRDNILNWSLVQVIYDWTSGKDFIDIMESSDAQEGQIIRTIMRLENLLKNFKSAAKIIGHMPLSHKIDVCQEVIKRDIVFTQSLYYEDDQTEKI